MAAIVVFREVSPMPWWSPGVFAGIGLAAIGQVGLRLPGWARTRASQMEAMAERAANILEESDAHHASRGPELVSGPRSDN
jgi:hypothetical protein